METKYCKHCDGELEILNPFHDDKEILEYACVDCGRREYVEQTKDMDKDNY
jgi:hypothetical protein